MLQAIAGGQTAPSGTALEPRAVEAAPFAVRVTRDDASLAKRLLAGRAGSAAIYTDHVKASHILRQVVLRQQAILKHVLP
ncbi:hypothetical protein J2X65_002722 [Ancylobacter sp. 3268]|uniref:hypothetical protein n=1 Tax=Ancylobacter sp. 3268 TaxID=2817752 RepID=UPI002863E1FC|nr:hypothetical protein [Ancylobacter sp. 3268]MDR6953361.1 hypothetical protein [Ancylobacter sp. 3268]